MKKFIKWFLIIAIVLGLGLFGIWKYGISQTKKASPEATVVHKQSDLELSVFYNRPSKKGRDIFGGLLPYGNVWRTGANETTTFKTNKDLIIDGEKLAAGKYSLFTIPGENQWEIIFNNEIPFWGVKGPNKASLNRKHDALVTHVEVGTLNQVVEMFTISFEESPSLALVLSWDKTKITIPLKQ